ncbi:MAG: helix-turn-helix domain-containing protein [Streptococcaceae bacterium]|jgi:phage repressor protein C with HTH and peptisase S24 domain/DNA-binding XRE family transcriptional regulator|nr:helix-turn-helix domain-containing protein [Streptococcaceae bacterium]
MDKEELAKYIGSKIKELRLIKNMTQSDLADLLKTTKQTIGRYEKGLRRANQDMLFELSDIFECSIDDFFPPIDLKEKNIDLSVNETNHIHVLRKLKPKRQTKVYKYAESELKEQLDNDIVQFKQKIPVALKIAASSTDLGYRNDTDIAEYENVYTDRDDLRNFDYAYYVSGDSMEPDYKEYDVVLVQRAYGVDNGSIYIVMHEETLYIKQVRINDGVFTMHSLNDKYDDINVTLEDAESYPVIIGKVVDSFTPLQVN